MRKEDFAKAQELSKLVSRIGRPVISPIRPKDLSYIKKYKPVKIERKFDYDGTIDVLAKSIKNSKSANKQVKEITEVVREITPEEIVGKINTVKKGIKSDAIDIEMIEIVEAVINDLKSRKGNDRLDISNIRNGEILASLATRAGKKFDMSDQRWHGGGITELTAGTGITLTRDENGNYTITNSSAGGYSIFTPTGTVDDSNTDFVFTSKPIEIVINGGSYIETGGAITWTWNPGTLTATLSSPVGTGGSIYGRL